MTNHTQHQQHQHQHQWQPAHDNGHWKGHDAYPPHHNSNQHDQGHWQAAAPVRDTNSNTVQPGESAILSIHESRTIPDQYQGHQWQPVQPITDVRGNPVQPGESTILPIQDPRTVPDQSHQWHAQPAQPAQPIRDEQGNVLQPGELSTLPVPDQLAGQHSWEHQADVNAIATPAPGADGQANGEAAGSSAVSWEPVQGSMDMGMGGNEFSIMPITMA